MPRVFIGVGSNIDPESSIPAALRTLGERVRIVGVSTFYRTPAVGCLDGPDFYNGVVEIETDIPPRELKFEVLRRVEDALGRVRGTDKNAPRPIDLDIAAYGDALIDEPDLVIPDPNIAKRAFLAVPLLELEPALTLPGANAKLADVVRSLDAGSMVALDEFTDRLRREIAYES
jgi:2-amino-4-hydroxy-6-hydroxymethyldihydropteridine diphosphokinase